MVVLTFHNLVVWFRHLEYYRGIIFLTTNLLGFFLMKRSCLGPAIISASRHAENNFLGWLRFFDPSLMAQDDDAGTQPVGTYILDLAPEDLDSLAEWNLSGREIMNILKNPT